MEVLAIVAGCITAISCTAFTIWASVRVRTEEDLQRLVDFCKSSLWHLYNLLLLSFLMYQLVDEVLEKGPISRSDVLEVCLYAGSILMLIMVYFVSHMIRVLSNSIFRLIGELIDGSGEANKGIVGVFDKIIKRLDEFEIRLSSQERTTEGVHSIENAKNPEG